MKRFHIALGVVDIAASVEDYSKRLGCPPHIVVDGEYALWKTDSLNFSIRKAVTEAGKLRHLGWENDELLGFSAEKDVNGILWEAFNEAEQLKEIAHAWPQVDA